MRLYGLEAEGVEIGFQVSAHAVGADQHEGADGIEGGSTHRRVVDAGLARNRRKGSGGGRNGSGGARGAAVQFLDHSLGFVIQIGEEALPLFIQGRSEEHTSEIQSLMRISYAVFCLKKK